MTHLVIHVLTPLHVGIGQAPGPIDLPVARQKPTNFPYIPGTTIKGCFRTRFSASDARKIFGPEPQADNDESAGTVFFGDAQLIAMPVRHKDLTFVWVTCRYLLDAAARIGLALGAPVGENQPITLENDLEFKEAKRLSPEANAWFASAVGHDAAFVRERLFAISNDRFAWACEFLTQIDVRNRIGLETGVVVDHALWAEESLAPETVLVAPLVPRSPEVSLEPLKLGTVVLGGKNTIGRGVCRVVIEQGGQP